MSSNYSLKLELTHISGDKLYPHMMKDKDTGMSSFRVTPPGGGNKKEAALQVNETEMLDYVINHNYRVRCSALTPTVEYKGKLIKRNGLYCLDNRSIVSYTHS